MNTINYNTRYYLFFVQIIYYFKTSRFRHRVQYEYFDEYDILDIGSGGSRPKI